MKPLPPSYTLLAVESSAGPASCALLRVDDGKETLLCSATVNTRLTHSQTLMPMIEDSLRNAGISLENVDALAVAVGPGSFTGVRIGVAAVKGLAFPGDLPCVPVSTLEGMARRLEGLPMTVDILTAMDARCRQVYTALFSLKDGILTRKTPDEAITLEELSQRLSAERNPTVVVGDGAALCCAEMPWLRLAPVDLRDQAAVGVARAAVVQLAAGEAVSGDVLLPTYLRLPQAERELRRRQAEKN